MYELSRTQQILYTQQLWTLMWDFFLQAPHLFKYAETFQPKISVVVSVCHLPLFTCCLKKHLASHPPCLPFQWRSKLSANGVQSLPPLWLMGCQSFGAESFTVEQVRSWSHWNLWLHQTQRSPHLSAQRGLWSSEGQISAEGWRVACF